MSSVRLSCNVVLLIVLLVVPSDTDDQQYTACDVFCEGPMLDVVQRSGLFEDDKTFIDMKMKQSIDETFKAFNEMMENANHKPNKVIVRRFVMNFFSQLGADYDRYLPKDWIEEPKVVKQIADRQLQRWAKNMNRFWKRMCRKVKDEIREHPNRYSIVYLPHPIIVPGGRYREYYYWDSYWTIIGLLRCQMYETAKGILKNFIILVKTYGFVPNGGRIYYLTRSNPPLLLPMFEMYFEITNDTQFIRENIDTLDTEFQFWMKYRTVEVSIGNEKLRLSRFFVEGRGPRPEAYRHDLNATSAIKSQRKKNELYLERKTACESGWDFSSRWYVKKGTNKGKLSDTKTSHIIPVDLNAIICWNAKILSTFYGILGMSEKKHQYRQIFNNWVNSVNDLLWDQDDGIWYDYDLLYNKSRKYFFPSNVSPLWTRCYHETKAKELGFRATRYLKAVGVLQYEGGIPSSLTSTGNHWDYPNAIPPLQHIVITGLRMSGDSEAKELAFKLAKKWIMSNYRGYIFSDILFDAYDANEPGKPGNDYDIDTSKSGHSWTNAVCLDLLYYYGKELNTRDINVASRPHLLPTTTISIICIVVRLL